MPDTDQLTPSPAFPVASLWRNPDFLKLWTGKTISAFGSEISGTAIGLAAILTLNASPLQLGLLGALAGIPALIIGLPAGVWVDRMRRKPIMIATDLLRAVALVTIPASSRIIRAQTLTVMQNDFPGAAQALQPGKAAWQLCT